MADDNTNTGTSTPSRNPGAKSDDTEPRRIADEPVGEIDTGEPTVHSPVTETGLPVEDQIDKQWDPNKNGGLPIFLRTRRR